MTATQEKTTFSNEFHWISWYLRENMKKRSKILRSRDSEELHSFWWYFWNLSGSSETPRWRKIAKVYLCNCSSHPHVISRSIINLRILKYLICRCKYWRIYFLCVLLTGKPCYNCNIILFSRFNHLQTHAKHQFQDFHQ